MMRMSVVREIRSRLEQSESEAAPELRDEVRTLLLPLADPERQWIGTVEVQRLLGVRSINTVEARACLGQLRSRRGPSVRLKVHPGDVLREARSAIWKPATRATLPRWRTRRSAA